MRRPLACRCSSRFNSARLFMLIMSPALALYTDTAPRSASGSTSGHLKQLISVTAMGHSTRRLSSVRTLDTTFSGRASRVCSVGITFGKPRCLALASLWPIVEGARWFLVVYGVRMVPRLTVVPSSLRTSRLLAVRGTAVLTRTCRCYQCFQGARRK